MEAMVNHLNYPTTKEDMVQELQPEATEMLEVTEVTTITKCRPILHIPL